MSEQYDNSNSGALFRNKDKGPHNPGSEKWADYNGSGEYTCEHCGKASPFWISAWLNTAKKSGEKFFGMKFKPKEARAQDMPVPSHAGPQTPSQATPANTNQNGFDDFDDPIPF